MIYNPKTDSVSESTDMSLIPERASGMKVLQRSNKI